ncbi:hypothetical protein LCGC14_1531810 [marine sediment metagenome]|uniref:Uncharacterized protein n=1 Tax=marine sediment metagenome TaxID=412755 RepID=A0A0F9JGH4_9ZZZZ
MTNREFAKVKEDFKKACEVVEIQPTVRQASKWRRKKGKAWKWLQGGTGNGKVELNRSQSKGH